MYLVTWISLLYNDDGSRGNGSRTPRADPRSVRNRRSCQRRLLRCRVSGIRIIPVPGHDLWYGSRKKRGRICRIIREYDLSGACIILLEKKQKERLQVKTWRRFNRSFFKDERNIHSSIIFPSLDMTTTCHGMNFPLARRAFSAARCNPPQQGTSMRTMVTERMSLFRIISVSFSV